jgi:hypothetical protein
MVCGLASVAGSFSVHPWCRTHGCVAFTKDASTMPAPTFGGNSRSTNTPVVFYDASMGASSSASAATLPEV